MNIMPVMPPGRWRPAASRRGFTLIELMVVAAVVGILAAVAYPSYRSSVVRGNRSAAQAVMLDIANREHQAFAINRAYAATLSDLGFTLPTEVSGKYTAAITVAAGPPPTFTITLTPVSGGAQDGDGALVVNSAGARTRDGSEAKWVR